MALSSYNSPCQYMISRSGFCSKWHAELQGFHFHLIVGKRETLQREDVSERSSNYSLKPSLCLNIYERITIWKMLRVFHPTNTKYCMRYLKKKKIPKQHSISPQGWPLVIVLTLPYSVLFARIAHFYTCLIPAFSVPFLFLLYIR